MSCFSNDVSALVDWGTNRFGLHDEASYWEGIAKFCLCLLSGSDCCVQSGGTALILIRCSLFTQGPAVLHKPEL